MSDQPNPPAGGEPRQPTEEEIREQLERVRVQDVVIQTIVSIVNLAAAKADDKQQLQIGIDAAKALLPLVQDELGPDAKSFQEAISQLQLAYATESPAAAPGVEQETDTAPASDAPGPAQKSGKLWVPGE
jgi:MoxR-like ATPase